MNWFKKWIELPAFGSLLIMQICSHEPVVTFQRDMDFNADWKFLRCEAPADTATGFRRPDFNDEIWETVALPHTARLESLVVDEQWQGICWYRKHFTLPENARGRKIFIEFEGAMQVAEVWINGIRKTTHYGGYLPFSVDISNEVTFGMDNVVAVRLDNRDNPQVPPGKPFAELDFCYFSGLYRNVKLHILNPLHISNAVYAAKVAGGGVFIRFPVVNSERAELQIQTHLVNDDTMNRSYRLVSRLYNHKGHLVAENFNDVLASAASDSHIVQTMKVVKPQLWSPENPYLYELHSLIMEKDRVLDEVVTRIGIRRFEIDAKDGFRLNGSPCYLRGTNYHQEFPYVGYAMSDPAHYRDARLIKDAGFNFVRLSHYPHAEAFMDACDELGIIVMDAIPGWQFFGDALFQERSRQDCRDMIRRDRNHASVAFWEVSLNESAMTAEFMNATQKLAREECPGDQCLTCGWQDTVYDVFIPARQHAIPPDYWNSYANDRALLIAEYGDWEYYAQNAGLNQADFANLTPEERNTRQRRGNGQKRLIQQVLNYQEAFNSNLAGPAIGCANWLLIDYNRGYADDIESSGLLDVFRLPKFAFYFFRSQEPPHHSRANAMLYIADYWMENTDHCVKVFSNCEQVELALNGRRLRRQSPDTDRYSTNLTYPPFTFTVEQFEPGTLTAYGFINGKLVVRQERHTPGEPYKLQLSTNCGAILPPAGRKDVFIVYATIQDKNGTPVPTATQPVIFNLKGPGRLIGANPIGAEAGIAAIVVESSGVKGKLEISAESKGLATGQPVRIDIK